MNDEDAIDAQRAVWTSALQASDTGAFDRLLTDGAVWMPPTDEVLEGKQAIEIWFAERFKLASYRLTVTVERFTVTGNWAIERGVFISRVQPKAGGPRMDHAGHYLLWWNKGPDGKWRIDRYADDTPQS